MYIIVYLYAFVCCMHLGKTAVMHWKRFHEVPPTQGLREEYCNVASWRIWLSVYLCAVTDHHSPRAFPGSSR